MRGLLASVSDEAIRDAFVVANQMTSRIKRILRWREMIILRLRTIIPLSQKKPRIPRPYLCECWFLANGFLLPADSFLLPVDSSLYQPIHAISSHQTAKQPLYFWLQMHIKVQIPNYT